MVKAQRVIITVDGPSGAGKTTLSRMLATRLGFRYVDTGALYRAMGWWVSRRGLNPDFEEELCKACETVRISIAWDQKGRMRVTCAGKDVTDDLRGEAMGMMASRVSAKPVVREYLWALQRGLGERGCLVFEGRDMGTRVFPDAPVRFFLTASLPERARRRWAELHDAGQDVALEKVMEDMARRDEQDTGRQLAPLRVPDGAVVIDTTGVPVEAVLERMVKEVKARLGEIMEQSCLPDKGFPCISGERC